MFFLIRLTLAICVVSFLLNGGRVSDPSTNGEEYPTSAHESAANVVYALSTLRTFCDDRPGLCQIAGEAAGLARSLTAEAATAIANALREESAPQERQAADLGMREKSHGF